MNTNLTSEKRKSQKVERAIDGAKATVEYRSAERASTERIAGLRQSRMARDAALAQDEILTSQPKVPKTPRKKSGTSHLVK